MTAGTHQELGRIGEQLARDYLEKKAYRIVAENYRTKLGEIDLVAVKEKVLVFIEVKTRTSSLFGEPEEAIHRKKIKKLIQIAQCFLKERVVSRLDIRFDVISVLLDLKSLLPKEIRHLEGAFET